MKIVSPLKVLTSIWGRLSVSKVPVIGTRKSLGLLLPPLKLSGVSTLSGQPGCTLGSFCNDVINLWQRRDERNQRNRNYSIT